MRQEFEDNYASYYVNTEVWSSDRLKKGRNIYANRYNDTSKRFRGFWHLMSQWKGSVIKLIYHDFFMYITIFMTINLVYRYVLYEYSKLCDNSIDSESWNCKASIARQWFEYFCVYCGRYVSSV